MISNYMLQFTISGPNPYILWLLDGQEDYNLCKVLLCNLKLFSISGGCTYDTISKQAELISFLT